MLATCRCGGEAVLQPSQNRKDKREAAQRRLADLQRTMRAIPQEGMDRIGSMHADIERITNQKVAARLTEIEIPGLQANVYEVRCKKCGTFIWDTAEITATNTWTKAIMKLKELKPCCAASEDRRTDYDGMVIVKCETCGMRHAPLDPIEEGLLYV